MVVNWVNNYNNNHTMLKDRIQLYNPKSNVCLLVIHRCKCYVLTVYSWVQLNLLLVHHSGSSQASKGRKAATHLFNVKLLHLWIKMTIFFVNKIMHNFQIGFHFVKIFVNQTYILAVFNDETSKGILFIHPVETPPHSLWVT